MTLSLNVTSTHAFHIILSVQNDFVRESFTVLLQPTGIYQTLIPFTQYCQVVALRVAIAQLAMPTMGRRAAKVCAFPDVGEPVYGDFSG